MIYLVDPRRLELLLELSRLGSMREVGEAMQVTTSTVSQQIAALAREAGTPLIEPDGRRVRLTPAGRRLAGHAVTILAAVEASRRYRDDAWIVNSRNTADEDVVRIVASLAGFEPRITQRADSLDLVHDMILAGLGVGLLPAGRPAVRGVTLRRLRQPEVILRSYAVTRRGHAAWPPLALVLRLVLQAASPGRIFGDGPGWACRRGWPRGP